MSQEQTSIQLKKKVYIIENLDCANCAAAVERRLNAMPEISEATLTFATKQLRITAQDPDAILEQVRAEAAAVEPGVEIYPRERRRHKNTVASPTEEPHAEPSHNSESCGCGHAHAHEHHEHGHTHGESCECGHSHGYEAEYHEQHEHRHEETCGCGHTHEHEHHEHEHTHKHEYHEHEHTHDRDCGCGHSHEQDAGHHEHHKHEPHHGDSCECRHTHEHEHKHEHHEHHHGETCCCGHEHAHEHSPSAASAEPAARSKTPVSVSAVRKVYTIENLDCANCAAAVERKIAAMPEVQEVTLTFATKQLRITAENPDALLDKIRKTAASVEPGVEIYPRTRNSRSGSVSAHDGSEFSASAAAGASVDTDMLAAQGSSAANHTAASSEDSDAAKAKTKKSRLSKENQKDLIQILIGAVCFAGGIFLTTAELVIPADVILLAGYLLLGGRIILTALKNLARGKVFDENFLMSLATVAAICIGDFKEAVGVMLFYRVGELFEEIAVERSRSQIMEAVDMRPEVVTKVHGNHTHVIPAEEAGIGDILQIRPGDRIPLDGTIVDGESRIDTSPVTGEPVPVTVKAGDAVVSGCVNTSGLLKMRVDKVLEESMVTKILDSVENAAASKPQIERFIARFARIYTPFVVILALLTAIVPSLFTGDWNYWIYTAITFLVISCPCALVLSVPLAFFSGIGAGSKRGILFKGGVSLEAMKNVRAVVMDKTGTITEGNFLLQEAVPAKGMDADTLLALCASCEQNSTHPIAQSILAAAKAKGLSLEAPSEAEEIAGHGIRAVLPQGEVLCGNQKLMERFHVQGAASSAGYGTEVFATLNGTFLGHLVIADTIKAEAADAISAIRSKGIVTAMLTGDAQENADAVARETGIDEVHARLLPQEKLEALQKIRAAHGSVMFVGDGINDAPVLAGADVGAAMGSGADAAIEAADVVFMTSRLDAVPKALQIAHASLRIARQNVVFALVIKALVMVLGLFHFANMWMAVFADTGVAMLCVLNSIRVLYRKD